MFGSNILMLDESISSLDSDLTNDILEVLKENLKDKIVFVVTHQIHTGIFDTVIDVDQLWIISEKYRFSEMIFMTLSFIERVIYFFEYKIII